jgi:hypothetical protein
MIWTIQIMAQNAGDAMMFSRYYSGGTARSAGMSGAFGALGGDLSVLSANPAGLAVYRGSEFTFTPGFIFTNTNAKYAGNTFNDRNTHVIINNIGYVYTKNLYNEKGLQTINLGIAYNRLSDFKYDTYIRREAATSSLLDEFTYYANGLDRNGIPVNDNDLHPFYEGLAYDAYAIDWDDTNHEYYSDYNTHGYGQTLYRSMSARGRIGEYDFSIGLNVNHQLFFGATLGLQDIYYKEYYFHEERPGFEYMNYFSFSDEYTVNGWGMNVKAGVIYRPVQELRIGAAIHSPTYLWRMKPYQLTGMETSWNRSPADDGTRNFYYETESDPSEKYRMTTPWRYSLSAATVIGRFAMVDVDLEMVNYSGSSITPKSTYDIENEDISKILKTAVNLKSGAEFRLGPVFLRGGVAYYGNPYNKDEFDADIKKTLKGTMSYSGGIGFRHRDFYMDAAYSFTKYPEKMNNLYLSYNATEAWYEQAKLQTNTGKFLLTFGFRF